MPRHARRPRSPNASQSLYANDDSEGDTEPETPRQRKSGLKKRISEAFIGDPNDPDAPPRQPLRAVNINDDAAEKRRRRKSLKDVNAERSGINLDAGPSNEGVQQLEAGETRVARQMQQLSSVAQAPVVNVPLDVMSSNFEEWMKMATDNKINAANSWNFALIDYFHDMSLLRNNTDNSINFQRASCTLDGCVKIWTSRVDSVGTETGKLLSNLANEGRAGDSEDEGSDNPDSQDPNGPKKRKHRAEATLAKNAAQLKSKKLDVEFSIDPLFKKTSADFDEGGAGGLLMTHLSLGMRKDVALRVIFDASDVAGIADEEEEDSEEPPDELDLSELRREFLPDLSVLDDKAISHSLSEFSFSKDAFQFEEGTFYADDTHHRTGGDGDDDDDENEPFADAAPAGDDGPQEDFFQGDQGVGGDDYNFGGSPPADDHYGGSADPEGGHGVEGGVGGSGGGGGGGEFVPFDPRKVPNERDLVMAMTDADGDGGMMNYFDQNFLKNWAGPEHWKLRKVIRKPDGETKPAKPAREKKEAFKIDFLKPPEKSLKELTDELFEQPSKVNSINLPGTGQASAKGRKGKKAKDKDKKDDHRLPDDMHFTSRQLVTLFLKPKFSLKMRGHRVRFNENGDGEVDENFWAQAAAEQAGRREENDETADGGAIPFNTQFFHDDYDEGPGFDDVFDGGDAPGGLNDGDGDEQDLLAATQGQTRKVRPETVNYAKRAKRVDVRKLKENIWKGLDIIVAPEEEQMEADEPIEATDPSEGRVFSNVISNLQRTYPRDKMDEISTSFCFICLLHLANEQGLKIEAQADDEIPDDSGDKDQEVDVDFEDKKVGNIWDLKVYRDPNATRSA